MRYPIKYNQITTKTEFYHELTKVYEEAKAYLMSFAWCRKIIQSDIYLNLGSTLCIFLFEIDNGASKDDNYLWVIVGDIPSMYLDIHGPKTTKQVLEDYIRLAEDWIEQVKMGKSIKNCYPFKAEPTLEMATLLEKRTSFMKNTLIENIEDIPLSLG
jgi:hypothetical protein